MVKIATKIWVIEEQYEWLKNVVKKGYFLNISEALSYMLINLLSRYRDREE